MSIVDVGLVLGLALALGWLALIQRRLAALPLAVWRVARQEYTVDDAKAHAALQAVTTAKVGTLVAGLRTYHDELAANLRAEAGAADLRARVVERRTLEVGVALDTAATLVRELRSALDRVSAPAFAPADAQGDPHERKTVEARLAPPAVAPPGSVEALPPEPAQKAAGLSRPQSTRPHPPPRRQTILGIPPPAAPAVPEEDRPSEEEVTRVAQRPELDPAGTGQRSAS
jgi:hypothetical protein